MSLPLSKNFTLKEMCKTDTGLDNIPETHHRLSGFFLCQFIMQPIRNKFGWIEVTSGYRCPEVNREVGGSFASQHMKFEVGDIRPRYAPLEDVYAWILGGGVETYGQLILYREENFLHISMPRLLKENKENLICENGIYRPYLSE